MSVRGVPVACVLRVGGGACAESVISAPERPRSGDGASAVNSLPALVAGGAGAGAVTSLPAPAAAGACSGAVISLPPLAGAPSAVSATAVSRVAVSRSLAEPPLPLSPAAAASLGAGLGVAVLRRMEVRAGRRLDFSEAASAGDLRRALVAWLPAPRSSEEVRRALGARARAYDGRRMLVRRTGAADWTARYALETVDVRLPRVFGNGGVDLGAHAQLGAAGVVDAIEAVAAAGVLSVCDITRACVAAASWSARGAPAAPASGCAPVASLLNPGAVQRLADKHGFVLPGGLPVGRAYSHGVDALYYGPALCATVGASTIANSSAHDDADRMGRVVGELLGDGHILDVTVVYEAWPLLPVLFPALHMVDKDRGASRRLIQDCSGDWRSGAGANHKVHPGALMPCRMSTVDEFGESLWRLRERHPRPAVLLLSLWDVPKAYRQVPARLDDLWQHAFAWAGRVYWSLRAYFGHRALGFWLCLLSWLVMLEAAALTGAAAGVFVDDAALADEASRMAATDAVFEGVCRDVGLPLHAGKRALKGPPAPAGEWVGVWWDLEAMTASVTAEKRERVRYLAASLLAHADGDVSRQELEEALGLVAFCGQVCPVLRCFTMAARTVLASAGEGARARLDEAARAEVLAWEAVLDKWNGVGLIPRRVLMALAAVAVSDASRVGIGFYCTAARIFCSERFPAAVTADAVRFHINLLELLAGFLCLVEAADALGAAPGGLPLGGVLQLMDNTVAVAGVSRLRTSSASLQPLVRAVAVECALRNVVPLASHLPGVQNLADPLSRDVIPASFDGWRRVRYSPELLLSLLTSSEPSTVLRGRPTTRADGGGS